MAKKGAIGDYSRAKLEKIIDDKGGGGTTSPGGSDTQVQYNNGGSFGGAASLTYNDSTGDVTVIDDKKLYFGTNSDAHIEYNEDGDNYMVISGSAAGLVLSGTTMVFDGEEYVGLYDSLDAVVSQMMFSR